MIASIIWGIVGMLVGVICATQLSWWQANGQILESLTFGAIKSEGISWLTYGRLRPLHTNAVIFAFVGNMAFAGIYYSTQRLCKCRTASDKLSRIHFWGWQAIIVGAAITLPLGLTQSKEYAELIWPLDLAVAGIWVVFAVNFFWTLAKRNEPSLYVALWFYIATIVTVAMLYIVNNLQIPTSLTHSYPIFGGLQDALVQWWYGHNAVAFFLTTPILGIMYYFLPKAANRPVYSYRLSIIHFWALVFIYIWAGPHHLLNTDLPKWLQMLGMFFSLMLWAPSWGGMLNGLLTLRGAWDKLRTDPVIKFFVVGITFYGMCTFEGPLLSIRAVNSLSHYTDWTIGHVHSGTLGWNGFMAAGMIYWMVPRLWGTKLHSISLANLHFWLGLVGILLYVSSMWISGVMQGLMLNATDESGTLLSNPNFVETLEAIRPMMLARVIGGGIYLTGFLLLAYNFFMTIRSGKPTNESREVVLLKKAESGVDKMTWSETWRADPVAYTFVALLFMCLWFFLPSGADLAALVCVGVCGVLAVQKFKQSGMGWSHWYDRLLENWMPFSVLTFIAVAIGGMVQIIPAVTVNRADNVEDRLQVPYTPLELAGRDLYVSEGCYNCHSQMIRTMVPDVLRYGAYSRIGESIYDHPFQWGSKRTGPDLAREGGRRSDDWHYQHMMNPRDLEPKSNMPAYTWLAMKKTDVKALPRKIFVQRKLGVPYDAMTKDEIMQLALEQGTRIATGLVDYGVIFPGDDQPKTRATAIARLADKQVVAIIAYLQKLGAHTVLDPENADPSTSPFDIPDRRRDHQAAEETTPEPAPSAE